ncbi:PREDICTED: uncharacterized protein LOC107103960 [Cyprinodon variegatus]|uniref:Uncharacterized LOC107103960 n=1 Tax=Cyprinodon variegatus TaxID=28743 RepID=A0A3Q2EKJ3_CYPVA|nr:PREDICTED: uncharacterized protein LOC107103960 [Cyprinodon variegatus]
METQSKKSNKVQKVVIGLLTIWSLIAIIILVVWATSPDLKGSAQCRRELKEMTEKLEGAKVVHGKDKAALEEKVLEAREEKDKLKREILLLLGHLNATNATLEACQQKNIMLAENISALQEDVRLLQQSEANLTEELNLQKEKVEVLELNLTRAVHQTESCYSLKAAAESQMLAAQSQTKACNVEQQYVKLQLEKCKAAQSEAPQGNKQVEPIESSPSNAPLTGIPALMLLICAALHLLT